MKLFAGGWIATKLFFYAAAFAAAVFAATETLLGIEWLPRRQVAYAFAIIIGIEWVARCLRRLREALGKRDQFLSIMLIGLFENVFAAVTYFGVASAAHLTTVLFAHEPGSVFFLGAKLFKQSVVFGLAVTSIVFTFVALRGEDGARLFFKRLGVLSDDPSKFSAFFPKDEASGSNESEG